MWWLLQTLAFSLIAIIILHYGWDYVKNKYSKHKTKDIAKIHAEKYGNIISEILETKNKSSLENNMNELENDLAQFIEQTLVSNNSPPITEDTLPI